MNIEAKLVSWLNGHTELGAEAYADVPNPRPESFITVERTGGQSDSARVDRPLLAIQCWAPTRYEASELAYEVRGLLEHDLIREDDVFNVDINSLYNYPDLSGGNPRYQIVIQLTTY